MIRCLISILYWLIILSIIRFIMLLCVFLFCLVVLLVIILLCCFNRLWIFLRCDRIVLLVDMVLIGGMNDWDNCMVFWVFMFLILVIGMLVVLFRFLFLIISWVVKVLIVMFVVGWFVLVVLWVLDMFLI